eukprot:TRINITY_DN3742_c3_g1_i2.p1 TRINITY_DN3742_c3_g1~~TRINITY_DN3742_c3_g1_i2.p1  ORF type:complete len:576 (+),score=144.18 TRINITY_DN3742_c3_g1_i2:69-1730(+)
MHALITAALCFSMATVQLGETGYIVYPTPGEEYPNNARMTWAIDCEDTVTMAWDHFDIEVGDLLTVSHTGGMLSITVASTSEPTILQGPITIVFTSNEAIRGTGFTMRWGCGVEPPSPIGVFVPVGTEDVIDFPAHGGQYPNNARFVWVINCTDTVYFSWEHYDIDLSFDSLIAFWPDGSLILTSFNLPDNLLGPVVFIFTSNNDVAGTGFRVWWGCGVDREPLPPGTEGTIVYPAGGGPYPKHARETWLINCHETVYFVWELFDIEDAFDVVTVHHANGSLSVERAFLPSNLSGPLNIEFVSDGTVEKEGFHVRWGCGVLPTPPPVEVVSVGEEGVVEHPTGGGQYGTNEELEWLINCNATVYFLWLRYEVEQGFDFVSVRHENGTFSLTDEVFPNMLRGPVTVQFTSDHSIQRSGFKVLWGCGVVPSGEPPSDLADPPSEVVPPPVPVGTGGTIVYPAEGVYPKNARATWFINCPAIVYFVWEAYDVEAGFDFVQVHHPHGIFILTNSEMPESLSGPLVIVFTSDNTVQRSGFRVRWSCGDQVDSAPEYDS